MSAPIYSVARMLFEVMKPLISFHTRAGFRMHINTANM